MHISDAEQRRWVHEQLERAGGRYEFSADERRLGLSLKQQEERKRPGGGEFRTTQSGTMTGSNLGDMIRQKMEENADVETEEE